MLNLNIQASPSMRGMWRPPAGQKFNGKSVLEINICQNLDPDENMKKTNSRYEIRLSYQKTLTEVGLAFRVANQSNQCMDFRNQSKNLPDA